MTAGAGWGTWLLHSGSAVLGALSVHPIFAAWGLSLQPGASAQADCLNGGQRYHKMTLNKQVDVLQSSLKSHFRILGGLTVTATCQVQREGRRAESVGEERPEGETVLLLSLENTICHKVAYPSSHSTISNRFHLWN